MIPLVKNYALSDLRYFLILIRMGFFKVAFSQGGEGEQSI